MPSEPRLLARLRAAFGRSTRAGADRRGFPAVGSVPGVAEVLATAAARWPELAREDGDDARPIFVLASSWRSGSTLLQRMIMASGEVLVWGEPWARAGHVQRLAESLRCVGPDHPGPEAFLSGRASRDRPLHEQWVANLYPEPAELRDAHRAFFRTLYAEPARRRGFARWGIKEVRLDPDHAVYLRWLFPAARLIFLHRDPYAAWRSFRLRPGWFERWPDEPVSSPEHFGRLWRARTGAFLERAGALGAPLVAYEALRSGEATKRLSEHLELELDDAVRARVITGARPPLEPVPADELAALRRAVEPLAGQLGYDPAGARR